MIIFAFYLQPIFGLSSAKKVAEESWRKVLNGIIVYGIVRMPQ